MKDLSLYVLDIAMNSVRAGAKHIAITLEEDSHAVLTLTIRDDGCGMSQEQVQRLFDPFYTTRKTRSVGLGVPFLQMLARQTDVEIVKKQDYIQTPNYNGYRSLHMDIKVPVYLSDRTEYVVAEIQLRTIAMDFWASLEHDIRYKVDKTKLPEGINEEMFECAGKIAEIDRQMQDMYQRIKASDAYNED